MQKPRPPSRTIPWLVTLGALAAFCIAIFPLTQRMRAFNANAHFVRFHADPILKRSFQIGAFPAVSLTDAQTESGVFALRLDYGSKSMMVPVKAPPARDLPNLSLYDEWAKVLAINEVVLNEQKQSIAKPGTERLLLVVRRTPEGFDPDAWGAVRRIEWVFDFYDLKPDGTIEYSIRRWPRKDRSETRLLREAAADLDKPPSDLKTVVEIDEWKAAMIRSKALAKIEPLKDRTLEHFAALHVMPKLDVPEQKFADTALSMSVLGWTLPVSMLSVLVFAGGLVFALAPRKRA